MLAKTHRTLALLLALCLLLPCTNAHAAQDIWVPDQVTRPTEPENTTTILGTVTRGDLKNTDTVSASKYYPYTTTVMSPDFQVTYVKHLVKRNDHVKAGDPLVEVSVTNDPIEMARLELNLRRAEDAFTQNMSQREDAYLVLQRQVAAETDPYEKEILQLRLQKEALSLERYRQQQEASVNTLREQVNRRKAQAATTTIYSPVDGLVTQVNKSTNGATLAPGTPLVQIADASVVLLEVSSNYFLTYGMDTEVTLNGIDGVFSGKVVSSGSFLRTYPPESTKQTAYVQLEPITDPEVTISSARVTGIIAGYENVLLAPYNAVFHNDADNYYYIYRLVDGQVQKRQVRILYRTGNRNQVTEDTRYWILWGVDEGDTLVSG